ncbi:hypothetical protein [Campylobacter majalis]|uniref:hypothetical protein n=1 Tax=Campylobacter majalis TaxID=2790656 RepID=UPI003D69B6A9
MIKNKIILDKLIAKDRAFGFSKKINFSVSFFILLNLTIVNSIFANINSNTATILNATNTHESYSIDKKTSVSIAHIQDILKDAKSGKSV